MGFWIISRNFVIGDMKHMQIRYFRDIALSPQVMRGIEELGFTELFPIQAQAIPPLLEGKDVIGQAQTGTGKTAAFGVPMIERLDPKVGRVQGLVLTPTRELAVQVADHMGKFGKYAGFKVLAVYGGESVQKQTWALERGVHIVIGTPGRVIDLMKRGTLNLSYVRILVLDEADRMLDMGFIEDIDYILRRLPTSRQTSLFSATIDNNVMTVCTRYMRHPEQILVSKDEIALEQINQYYMVVNEANKFEALCNILDQQRVERAIIFCRTRTDTSRLAEGLQRRRYNAKALHAGFTQAQRDFVTNAFRQGRLRLMVATDVAARGLDIEGVTHIINYDVPVDAPVYFHRIGRTARKGGEGTAITLVGYGELSDLENIRALTKTTMEELDESKLCGPVV
jgi:ATP-dependent RNA helicase DeaD